ncbi:hypothetical protein LINPERHAP1_LOCUS29645, partial [Linum perenne]
VSPSSFVHLAAKCDTLACQLPSPPGFVSHSAFSTSTHTWTVLLSWSDERRAMNKAKRGSGLRTTTDKDK